MMVFRPLPHATALPAASGGQPELVEVPIPSGTTCRYLALPPHVAENVLVSLREGDHGFPGTFFVAGTLGRSPENRGGYIGENVGPTTLRIWFHAWSLHAQRVVGAVCFEDGDSEP